MSAMSRYVFVLVLVGGLATVSCREGSTPAPAPVMNFYQVVTISDLHFNPLYDQTLYSKLVAADPSQWAAIYQGSNLTAPTGGGTDTNYPLLVLTLASMKQHMAASPVVLFTGDMLGHNIPAMFYAAYYKESSYPSPDPAAVAAMQQFIDKTMAFVAQQIRLSAGNAPVMYVVGNIDAYAGSAGPDSTFLTDNAGTISTQFLASSADQQTFVSTFASGGYYSAQPLGLKLLVIGLNTNSFVDGGPTTADANTELDWLNSQLAAAQAAGQKVWILMHVPPGANSQYTALSAAKAGTLNQVNESTTSMMWDSGYQATFLQTLGNYPGVVTLMLAGHTHMDEYRILSPGNVLEQLPGISPCFGNNPAFKVFTIAKDTLTATDYDSFYYDLARMPAQFNSLYELSIAYGAQGPLGTSLQQLYAQLVGSQAQRTAYTVYFASGSTAMNPVTQAPWNPITSANWPIFACTISEIDEPDYIQCVNTD